MDSELDSLFRAAIQLRKQNYSTIASLSILIYDILINFSDEVQYIWCVKWSLPKALYIVARYYAPIYLSVEAYVNISSGLPINVCKGYYWFYVFMGDPTFSAIVIMLFAFRMYVLYGKDRRVLVFLVVLWIASFTAEMYTCAIVARTTVKNVFQNAFLTGCPTIGPAREITLIAWIPNLIVNFIFFVASLAKMLTWPTRPRFAKYANPGPEHSIFTVCLRDGTLFYLLITIVVIVNMITTLIDNGVWSVCTNSWLMAVYSFSGVHVVLNLRRVAAETTNVKNATKATAAPESINLENMYFPGGPRAVPANPRPFHNFEAYGYTA